MTKTMSQTLGLRPFLTGVALLATAFGMVTVFAGGAVLFGPDPFPELAGRYVPFIVWFNFCAGFLYIAAGVAIWLRHPWSLALSATIALGTTLAAVVFGIWVILGGAYEMRTVGALAMRFGFWAAIVLIIIQERRRL